MKIVVVAVGKLKGHGLRDLSDDYLKRIRRHVAAEEVEVRDACKIDRSLPAEATVVALEVDGERMTSAAFAERLERWGSRGKGVVAFVVGGPREFPPASPSARTIASASRP